MGNTLYSVTTEPDTDHPHGLRSLDTSDGAHAELWFTFAHDRDATVALFNMLRGAFRYVDILDDGTEHVTAHRSEAMR